MGKKKNNPVADVLGFAGQEKKTLGLSVAFSVISVILGIVPYIAVGRLLYMMLVNESTTHDIVIYAAGIAAALVLEKIFAGISTRLSHKAAYGILKNIRCTLIDKIEKASMGWISGQTSGAFKESVIDKVDSLEDALAHMIPELLPNIILPVVVIVYLFITDWRIALISMISIVIGFLAWGLMLGKNAMNVFNLTQQGNRQMNETIVEYINGMEVIKSYQTTSSALKKYEDTVTDYKDRMLEWYQHCHPYLSVYMVVMPATICFILPAGGLLMCHAALSAQTFIKAMVLSLGIVGPLTKVVTFTDHFNEIYAADIRIQEILQAPELQYKDEAVDINDFSIEFKNVSFGYEEKEVLHDISFKINQGEKAAIIGPSGSGKSTLARLVARFFDVNKGSIYIGKTDIRSIPSKQLMDCISYVTQDNFLANTTIRENIRMGKPDATEKEINDVVKKACCDDFIKKLPKGLDTNAGDAGSVLSGGERQRIAIARVMLKDAPIVILDEATASVDNENQYRLGLAIRELTKNKTLIVIAHRLSTIKDSDQIFVVKSGKIIASGTHNELIKSSTEYLTMWNNNQGAQGWSIGKEKR